MEATRTIINIVEAGEILAMTPRAVLYRIANGSLPAEKLPGKTGSYILERADVEALRDELAATA